MAGKLILSNIFVLSAGALIGAGISYIFTRKKYERIANDEIASVKKMYTEKEQEQNKQKTEQAEACVLVDEEDELTEVTSAEDDNKGFVIDYSDILTNNGYANTKKKGGDILTKRPYVIPPSQFDENANYVTEHLTCYADGILADDRNHIIEDPERMIGDALKHIGEYEPDSVHVRDDEEHTDYEILVDLRNYYDVVGYSPNMV